jgi:hypothetical protein
MELLVNKIAAFSAGHEDLLNLHGIAGRCHVRRLLLVAFPKTGYAFIKMVKI